MSDYSVLLLAYGQSNADVYPAEPALNCPAFEDPRIVTFDDGNGFRGRLGGIPKVMPTALVPAAEASRQSAKCRNYQSFQIAAAARLLHEFPDDTLRHVIVRAEGRGGRRFHGIVNNERHIEGILNNADGSDSQILLNMLATIRHAADLADKTGAPLRRIFVNFIHGEADRSTAPEMYLRNFSTLIARVADQAAELGVPVDWLILDPAGTSSRGSGNKWPCRLVMADLAQRRENVHLIGAGYAYPLDDVIHYSATARALFGEHFGAAIAGLLSDAVPLGWLRQAPRLERAVLSGAEVDLHLDSDQAFSLVAGISDDALGVEGFQVTQAARCHVVAAHQTGPQSVRVRLGKEPVVTDPRAALSYAFQVVSSSDARSPSPMPAARGGWRSEQSLPSLCLPDQRIHQWVPGFIIPFAEMLPG